MTRHLFATILVLASVGGSFASAATHRQGIALRDAHKGDEKQEKIRPEPEEETRLADENSTSKPTKKEKNIDAVNKESEIKERSSSIVGQRRKPNVAQETDSKAEKEFAVDNTRERFESYVKDAKDGKISHEECVVIAKKYYEIEEYVKSFALNTIAAEGGNEEAQETLDRRFGVGMWPWSTSSDESIRHTYTEMEKWFKLATEKFDTDAQYNIGLYNKYISGGIIPYLHAVEWWKVAATLGHAEAQFSIGRHFYERAQTNDEEREKLLERATKYLKMASDQGFERAAKLLTKLKPDEKTQEKFSSPVVQEVSDKARRDCLKGILRYNDENSLEEAVEFFTSSAHEGFAVAQFYLGLCYMGGKGVKQDSRISFIWFLRAAERGHARAQFALAQCYGKGMGVRANSIEAFKWYVEAAEQDDADAQFELALYYLSGTGVTKDTMVGIIWLRKAAANGNSSAAAILKKLGV